MRGKLVTRDSSHVNGNMEIAYEGGVRVVALDIEHVTAGYAGHEVLQGMTMQVQQGEFVVLIGPNGCGKSTLLKTASGLLRPSAGCVRLFGRDVSGLKPGERARLLGVVPQKVESPMAYTVAEIVMNGRTGASMPWQGLKDEDYVIMERAMIYTNVLSLADRYFTELSGGEQQRVILAMVLAQEPQMIMLDESISHLDINHRYEVLRILRRMNREHGLTVVLVSHDLTLSSEIADRMILMHEGVVQASGLAHEVLCADILSRVYDCELLVQHDALTGTVNVSGVLDGTGPGGQACRSVHVVAGGGTGIELYRRLGVYGFRVTTGVLNRMDSDAEAARALGIEAVLDLPFSAISTEAAAAASRLACQADVVVLAPVPFGSGNLVNLDILRSALQCGKEVWIADGVAERDYTEGKVAAAVAAELVVAGARLWSSAHELLLELRKSEK